MRDFLLSILIVSLGVVVATLVAALAAVLAAYLAGYAAGQAGFVFRRARAWLRVHVSPSGRQLARETRRGARLLAEERSRAGWLRLWEDL